MFSLLFLLSRPFPSILGLGKKEGKMWAVAVPSWEEDSVAEFRLVPAAEPAHKVTKAVDNQSLSKKRKRKQMQEDASADNGREITSISAPPTAQSEEPRAKKKRRGKKGKADKSSSRQQNAAEGKEKRSTAPDSESTQAQTKTKPADLEPNQRFVVSNAHD